jgi:hypothetical protein
MLWAGLIHEEANIDEDTGEATSYNITPYQVGAWIKNPQMLKDVSEKMSEAMSAGTPPPKDSNVIDVKGNVVEAEFATVVLTPQEQAEADAENEKNV